MTKIAYNYEQELVVYSMDAGVSCFGLTPEKALEISPELGKHRDGSLPLNYTEVSEDVFAELYSAHKKERFVTVRGFEIPRGIPRKITNAVIDAFHAGVPVMIEYEEGHEMFNDDGIHDESGRIHTCWIGSSTGKTKTLLHLERENSSGGCSFFFHGIKSVTPITSIRH